MTNDLGSFQYISSPLRLFYGEDSLSRIGRELDRIGSKRAVIVTGAWFVEQISLFDPVRDALGDRCAGVYGDVIAHSPVASVLDAADRLASLNADAVIAVGGGSSIVTARAASIMLAEGRDARKLSTQPDGKGGLISPKLLAPKLPQFIIPTTPATAFVKAGSAVFDPESGDRLALYDPKTRAHAIFLHPQMLGSASVGLVGSASLNTFSTTIEGLMSRQGNPMADAQLMHALRLLDTNLRALPEGDSATLRGELTIAAALCGQGTDHTAAGITTVLGHAIGARYEVDNGLVNAVVLPEVLRFNADAAEAGLAKVAAALSLPAADPQATLEGVLAAIDRVFVAARSPKRLRDLRVPAEDLAEIAQAAMGDWFLAGNPKRVTEAGQLLRIMEAAW
jgi:alcohol dehydrogenase class IV